MKKALVSILIMVFLCSTCFAADERVLVLKSLKEVQNVTEVGVTYVDYSRALQKVNLTIKEYLKTHPQNDQFVKLVDDTWLDYEVALSTWTMFRNSSIPFIVNGESLECREHLPQAIKICSNLIEGYPEFNVFQIKDLPGASKTLVRSDVLSVIWSHASKKIAKLEALARATK